ncbi:MAG: lactate utilization protein C [Planctomycetaceae bacterium]
MESPAAFTGGITFADPVAQFGDVLSSVGGQCEQAATLDDARHVLSDLVRKIEARKICSLVEGIELTNVDPKTIRDPHDLNDVDLAIMPGQIAVAENAAVWVTAGSLIERTLFFLAQHLVLVVPRRAVVSNLHEAYERVDVAASAFGTWISGPSKTADIEQSLVIGAHGPRSLLVILIGER